MSVELLAGNESRAAALSTDCKQRTDNSEEQSSTKHHKTLHISHTAHRFIVHGEPGATGQNLAE